MNLQRYGICPLRLALAAHVAIMAVVFTISRYPASGDFGRFWEIGSTPGRPYADYQVERGPLEAVALKGLAAASGSRPIFGQAVVVANLVADAVIVAALLWGWGATAATFFALAAIPILDILCARIDLWSVAAATIAVAAWQRDRPVVTAWGLAAGAAFKLWPLPFGILLLAPRGGRLRVAPIATFATLMFGAGVMWWTVAGWSGFRQVLTFRGAHGWQIESVVGSVLIFLGRAAVRDEAGAARVGMTGGATSMLMLALAAPLTLWGLWRGGRSAHVGAGWLAAVSALLLCSALFSPQFVAWLLPGGAIAWVQRDRRPAIMTATVSLLTALEMAAFYDRLHDGSPVAALFVIVRNLALLGVLVSAGAILKRERVGSLVLPNDLRPVEGLET